MDLINRKIICPICGERSKMVRFLVVSNISSRKLVIFSNLIGLGTHDELSNMYSWFDWDKYILLKLSKKISLLLFKELLIEILLKRISSNMFVELPITFNPLSLSLNIVITFLANLVHPWVFWKIQAASWLSWVHLTLATC